MLDFTKWYQITLQENGEDVYYPCEIINYNTDTQLYTVSIRGLGTVKIVEESRLTEI